MSQDSETNGTSRLIGEPPTRVVDHGGPSGAPQLILLHGFGGSALNWEMVAPHLADCYRVIAVDLYAHGLSAAPARLRAADVVAQIKAVIDSGRADQHSPVVLVAGSFGATMALQVAAEHPGLIAGIVAVNGAIPQHPRRRLDLAMTFKRWLISTPGVSGLVFRKTSSMTPRAYVELQLTGAGVNPATVDPAFMQVSTDLEAVRHRDRPAHESQQHLLRDLLRIFARGQQFSAMTAAVDAPVRWLHSDSDPLIPFDLAREFVAEHPAWSFASREGLGHVPMVSDPAWVTHEILSWVDQLVRGRR